MSDVVSKPLVALIQSNPGVAEEIEHILENHGFRTVTYVPHDFFQRHEKDVVALLESHKPDAVIYDIVTPYAENWKVFKKIQSQFHGKSYLITTVDKNLLENYTSEPIYFQIRGRNFNSSLFYEAFRKSFSC